MSQQTTPDPPFQDPGIIHEKIGWFLCVGVPLGVAAYTFFRLSFFEVLLLETFLLKMALITGLSVFAGISTWLRGVYLYRTARCLYRKTKGNHQPQLQSNPRNQ